MTSTEATGRSSCGGRERERRTGAGSIAPRGSGGVGVFVAWAAQPVIVGVMSPRAPENGPDFALTSSRPRSSGVTEAIVFSAIGVAMLFLVTAVGQLAASAGRPSTAARVGHLLGVLSGISWFFVAGSVARALHVGRIPPRRGSAATGAPTGSLSSCGRSCSPGSSRCQCSASLGGLSCSQRPGGAPESSAGR